MALNKQLKENWEKLQEKYNYPVDALGRPIDPKDQETLRAWQQEGIDRFQKK
jgi:DNA replication protein DnaD